MAAHADTFTSEERARRAGVLRPLPRRARLAAVDAAQAGFHQRQVRLPNPRLLMVAFGLLRAGFAGFVFALGMMKDRITGTSSVKRTGERLRAVFERLGGTAIKI